MSDGTLLGRPRLLLLAPLLFGCGSAPAGDASGSSASELSSASSGPALTFAADWTEAASQPLVAGAEVRVAYDAARLPSCRGDLPGGAPGWTITAFYAIDGIPLGSFPVAGAGLSNTPAGPLFTPPFAGDLAMWFQIGSAWGCTAYDSSYGKNFHFQVGAPANAPGWVGGASALIDRATCGSGNSSGPCYADARPADAGFTFDTWARERALITQVFFDAWKAGVTDWNDPDLWRQLDVELHWRLGSTALFTTSYVDFSEHSGNDARYAIDLRALDPLPDPQGGPLTNPSQCPALPVTVTADGQYVQASVEYYFTVNGVALGASGGGVLRGVFQNYAGLYAICSYGK